MFHSVFIDLLEQIKVGIKPTAFDFTRYDYSNEPDRQAAKGTDVVSNTE